MKAAIILVTALVLFGSASCTFQKADEAPVQQEETQPEEAPQGETQEGEASPGA